MAKRIITRYFLLSSVQGREEQIGIALEANSRGRLEDLTDTLILKRIGGKRNYYQADTGGRDMIRFRVRRDASVEIIKQPNYAMVLSEIREGEAIAGTIRLDLTKGYNHKKFSVISGGNPELSLPPSEVKY